MLVFPHGVMTEAVKTCLLLGIFTFACINVVFNFDKPVHFYFLFVFSYTKSASYLISPRDFVLNESPLIHQRQVGF